jgi:Ca2+-binding RTX toxin-like protein
MATPGDDLIFGTTGPDFVDGLAGNDTIIGLEGNDTLIGGPGNDILDATNPFEPPGLLAPADDSLVGGAGNDILVPGPGHDTLDGGDGFDTVIYTYVASGGVHLDLSVEGPQSVGGGMGVEQVHSIEQVIGTPYDDTFFGSNATDHAEVFEPGPGNDFIDGRGGQNVVDYGDATSGITVDLNKTGPQDIGGGEGFDTLRHIQVVAGGPFGDLLIGGREGDILQGQGGNDTLIGGAGNDLLIGDGFGQSGNDSIDGGAGYDVARFTGAVSDYSFEREPGGKLVVTDLRPGSPDGTDTLTNVEALQFGPIQFDSHGFMVAAPDIPVGVAVAYYHLHELAQAAPAAAQAALDAAADQLIARYDGMFAADPLAA